MKVHDFVLKVINEWAILFFTSNILLYDEEGNESIYLIDLGEAQLSKKSKLNSTTMTKHGTLLYMAPERFQKSGEGTYQSDIWSSGVTFYELIHLKPPFGDVREIIEADKRQPKFENSPIAISLRPLISK